MQTDHRSMVRTDMITWIFKNKEKLERRRNDLIDRFCKLVNENEKEGPICRFDSFVQDELQPLSENEIEDIIEELEEYYRKPLQKVK